jgi:hypothetical protein
VILKKPRTMHKVVSFAFCGAANTELSRPRGSCRDELILLARLGDRRKRRVVGTAIVRMSTGLRAGSIVACSARAASGHDAAAPNPAMKLRLCMAASLPHRPPSLRSAETAAAQITGGGLARIEKRAKLNET